MTATSHHFLTLQSLQPLASELPVIKKIAACANAGDIRTLHPHALRLTSSQLSNEALSEIRSLCEAAQIDLAHLPSQKTLADFSLVAMDMDSTLITIECIDEIADMQGLKPQVAEITEAAMRGELDFSESLQRRVGLLKGLDAGALQQVLDQRLRLSPGAEKMLQAVQRAGLKTLLVSGGFTFFTEHLKQRLGLDFTHANQLEIEHGKLTGRVLGGIVDAEQKRRTVTEICQQIGVGTDRAIVMGDGANDLKMMGIAGLSLAFRAKPVVRSQANIALNFVGLDGLLTVLQ